MRGGSGVELIRGWFHVVLVAIEMGVKFQAWVEMDMQMLIGLGTDTTRFGQCVSSA